MFTSLLNGVNYLFPNLMKPKEEAKLIDGRQISKSIINDMKTEVTRKKIKPCLAVVLVGERKDSQTYVRMKEKRCKDVGIESIKKTFSEDVSQEVLLQCVQDLNANVEVDGILVQLPLPKHINEEAILNEISIDKDVDGFHAVNIGRLCQKGREPQFVPCTPRGCIELLDQCGIEISGKKAVVIGRSNIVGIPVASLLMHRNATVTICHSRTSDEMMPMLVRQADIVVAACGQALMVKKEWLKDGAVVIDVGMNNLPDESKKRGYRLVGDVDFEDCKKKASWITPVPGGVGPMTICMLLRNTIDSHIRRNNLSF